MRVRHGENLSSMQNWKNFILFTGSATGARLTTPTINAAAANQMRSQRPIHGLTFRRDIKTAASKSCSPHSSGGTPANSTGTPNGGGGGSSGVGKRRPLISGSGTHTISSSRKQSTTQATLAARQVMPQLAVMSKEMLASVAEDEDEDYETDEDEDNLIYERRPSLASASSIKVQLSKDEGTNLAGALTHDCQTHRFVHRHIGPREEEMGQMLSELGYSSLEQLIEATIPEEIKLKRELKLPQALSEHEILEQLRALATENEAGEWKSYIGLGYYDCVTPPAILRNLFENPGWTTAYTAYQAEIAQGRLESLMNYQTMISDLTGLDVANASLLDESTAAAEAMQVCLRYDKLKRNKLLLSSRCHPQTLAVVETRAKALGVQVDKFDELLSSFNGEKGEQEMHDFDGGKERNESKPLSQFDLSQYSGVLIQYPNTHGHLFDLNPITSACHEAESLLVVATDLMACCLFKPPGEFEHKADLVVGSSQRFGVPLNYGGPHAGFLACKQHLLRSIPGRVVGLTRDSNGNKAYRFALQTREQHIRRGKATSNICTAQALLANMSAMYAVYHGPKGLREIAEQIHMKTSLLAHLIKQTNLNFNERSQTRVDGSQQLKQRWRPQPMVKEILNYGAYFDTLTLRVRDQLEINERARKRKINLRYLEDGETICISLDETTKLADIFNLATLFLSGEWSSQSDFHHELLTKNIDNKQQLVAPLDGPLKELKRTSKFLTHPVFNSYKSEAQLVRYMKSLENKDVSLVHSMIPLGSCTMKLNATSQMVASSWPEFTRCHPFQPSEQCLGYQKIFSQLDEYLCEITGYDRISFQPNSGAQGEYAGLCVIKSYLESKGQYERNVCLIPISAHGTNPASAQMAGFKIQTIKVNDDGNIDLEDLTKNIERHRKQLACLMVTYPSTFGVFEEGIKQVCEMIHEAGGQVYLDGANMNAQVGLCRPGDYGSDVSHLNLHKTFCIPHGGGGPGAGPIGVKKHLIPYLPTHPIVGRYDSETVQTSFGTVSASMWGSPAILPISWSYIRLMSQDLKLSSQVAILNANYMRKRLEPHYKILYKGKRGNVAHEFILDCRPFKKTANVEASDIAKRLQDFGLHAPTVSWPVSNTLMLEPTESEDKEQLDKYCEALIQIRREIEHIEQGKWDKLDNPIKNAPHTQQVVCSSDWSRAYTREEAAFPAKFVTPLSKFWPSVGRVDDTYGDTNLFCSCG